MIQIVDGINTVLLTQNLTSNSHTINFYPTGSQIRLEFYQSGTFHIDNFTLKQRDASLVDFSQMIAYFENNYCDSYENQQLIADLTEEFICSEKIIRERLKEIVDKKFSIKAKDSSYKFLTKIKQGKNTVYQMVDVESK